MNKLGKLSVLIIVLALVLSACFSVDKPQKQDIPRVSKSQKTDTYTYDEPKNITINGVDYLQSQLPVGKFGGEFVTSTIG